MFPLRLGAHNQAQPEVRRTMADSDSAGPTGLGRPSLRQIRRDPWARSFRRRTTRGGPRQLTLATLTISRCLGRWCTPTFGAGITATNYYRGAKTRRPAVSKKRRPARYAGHCGICVFLVRESAYPPQSQTSGHNPTRTSAAPRTAHGHRPSYLQQPRAPALDVNIAARAIEPIYVGGVSRWTVRTNSEWGCPYPGPCYLSPTNKKDMRSGSGHGSGLETDDAAVINGEPPSKETDTQGKPKNRPPPPRPRALATSLSASLVGKLRGFVEGGAISAASDVPTRWAVLRTCAEVFSRSSAQPEARTSVPICGKKPSFAW